ncbi:MAG: response regulator, partial [Anaerolineales bacterium]|nr:response regulator [Anaerolineales bacterium]
MGSAPIRLLMVDDHPLINEAIRLLIEKHGMEFVGPATTGSQAIDMTLEFEPDIVLLDILMPGMDGLQALARIKSARPTTAVIIL